MVLASISSALWGTLLAVSRHCMYARVCACMHACICVRRNIAELEAREQLESLDSFCEQCLKSAPKLPNHVLCHFYLPQW